MLIWRPWYNLVGQLSDTDEGTRIRFGAAMVLILATQDETQVTRFAAEWRITQEFVHACRRQYHGLLTASEQRKVRQWLFGGARVSDEPAS